MTFDISKKLKKGNILSYDDMIVEIYKKEEYSVSFIWEYKDIESWKIYDISENTEQIVNIGLLLDWKQYDFVYGWGLVIVLDIEKWGSYTLIPTRSGLECVYINAY